MKDRIFLLFPLICLITACSPKFYLTDRQTVLEDEAAGEWPEFEKELLQKTIANGPTQYPKTAISSRSNRLYTVLDGELAGIPAAASTSSVQKSGK